MSDFPLQTFRRRVTISLCDCFALFTFKRFVVVDKWVRYYRTIDCRSRRNRFAGADRRGDESFNSVRLILGKRKRNKRREQSVPLWHACTNGAQCSSRFSILSLLFLLFVAAWFISSLRPNLWERAKEARTRNAKTTAQEKKLKISTILYFHLFSFFFSKGTLLL